MTGIIASIRARLGRDERKRTGLDLETVATEIPAEPSDTYCELGVAAEELLVELARIDGGWA